MAHVGEVLGIARGAEHASGSLQRPDPVFEQGAAGVAQEKNGGREWNERTAKRSQVAEADFGDHASQRGGQNEQRQQQSRKVWLPFEIAAEGDEGAEKREGIKWPLALAVAQRTEKQNARDGKKDDQVPRVGGVGFMIGVNRRGEGSTAPSGSGVVDVDAHSPVCVDD